MSAIVIGDVHGNLETLKALLGKIPNLKNQTVIFTGDLIDRGSKSKEVVQFVIDNGYYCVLGNHEDLMICDAQNVINRLQAGRQAGQSAWTVQGGFETLWSYEVMSDEHGKLFDLETFEEHVKWMSRLPKFLEFPCLKNKDGRHLIVSHSFIGNVYSQLKDIKLHPSLKKKAEEEVIWGRTYMLKDNPTIYNIHGHTPNDDNPRIKSFYANKPIFSPKGLGVIP